MLPHTGRLCLLEKCFGVIGSKSVSAASFGASRCGAKVAALSPLQVAIRNFSQPNLKVEFDNGHRDHLPAPQGSQVYLTQSNLPCRLVNKDRTLCTLTTVS
mmetsp:Transcript_57334/g.124623  ORF Transcript_57334/g.124623 Transcript_57334/m.124623 type:complete len:101 (-) Transcript_57334:78-380(-)